MCYSLTWTRLAHVCRLFTLIAVFFKPIGCRGPLAAKVLWLCPWNWQQGGWETNLANPPMRRLEMFFPTKSFPKVGLLRLKDPMCVLWQHLVVRKCSAKKWHIYLSGRSLCSWMNLKTMTHPAEIMWLRHPFANCKSINLISEFHLWKPTIN